MNGHAIVLQRFHVILEKAKLDYKHYQYSGLQWILKNEMFPNFGLRGGILADEMGLGKTIMMIGTIYCHFVKRTLIVVPPILLEQWKEQIYKLTGHKALVYYGTAKKDITTERLSHACIVLTTYSNASLGKFSKEIQKLKWDRVIYDEAHHLRNSRNKTFEGCKKINATVCWLITGTPIQNKKKDLLCLCELFGLDKRFCCQGDNLVAIIKKILLRRTKAEVRISLPTCTSNSVEVAWKGNNEEQISKMIHSLFYNKNTSLGGMGGLSRILIGSEDVDVDEKSKKMIYLIRSRQSCIHYSLMEHKIRPLILENKIPKEYLDILQDSSKINSVIENIVLRKENGKGKLIFCHFRKEIDIIRAGLLANGFTNIVVIDGRNKGLKRKNDLKRHAEIIILQVATCCEGLNLQEFYSEVHFVSPHWNPFIEEQAIARCYRIGQQKEVHVFRYFMKKFEEKCDSIERYISVKQEEKKKSSLEYIA